MKKTLLVLVILLLMGVSCIGASHNEGLELNGKLRETNTSINISNKYKLDLSRRGLENVAQSVFRQVKLQELDVSYNKLTGALPAEIRQLQKLKILNASNNQMTGVPAEVGQLDNLIELDLSDNKLTGLPHELGNLKNLKILDLSGNQVSKQDLDIIRKNLSSNIDIIE